VRDCPSQRDWALDPASEGFLLRVLPALALGPLRVVEEVPIIRALIARRPDLTHFLGLSQKEEI
jgi:hypothetical protein